MINMLRSLMEKVDNMQGQMDNVRREKKKSPKKKVKWYVRINTEECI